MQKRMRLFSLGVLAVLSTAVVGVSLAWACTDPSVGVPSAGSAPPAPKSTASASGGGGNAVSGGAAVGAPAGSSSASSSTSGSTSASGSTSGASASGSTSGAIRSASPTSVARRGAQTAPVAGGFSPVARSQFAARLNGATAGVTSRGGQAVFASSVAPKGKAATSAVSPSIRGAAADVWSGLGSSRGGSPSLAAAQEGSSSTGGLGSSLAVGLGILGFGVAGLLGTALVAGARRRRAESRSREESR